MSCVYTSVIYIFAWSLAISNHPHFLTDFVIQITSFLRNGTCHLGFTLRMRCQPLNYY